MNLYFRRSLVILLVFSMIVSSMSFSTFAVNETEHNHDLEESFSGSEVIPEEREELYRQINEQVDIVLTATGAKPEMTDEEIANAVTYMDGSGYEAVFGALADLEELLPQLTQDEIDASNKTEKVETFGRVYAVIEALYTPMMTATSGNYNPVTGVNVGVSGATNTTHSSGVVTVTAKGSAGIFGFGASSKTATITITNDSDNTATLSFDWTATSVNELKIDGTVYGGTSGSFSKVMNQGENFKITITTAKNNTENKLVMNNFSIVAAKNESNVKFLYDSSLGSVTVGGNAVGNEGVVSISKEGTTIQATRGSDVTFLGWINASTHEILSRDASYTLTPAEDMTVQAVFAKTSPWFLINNSCLYEGLNAALTAVASVSNKTVVLANNGTLPAGNYTIPAGVTLLIPFDATNTTPTTPPRVTDNYETPTIYRTLTMASGAHITVNGAVCVGGSQSALMPPDGYNGCVSGPVGRIHMVSGSTITINAGANLYAWGYVTGSGSVTAENKATVYESFQVRDYRGGDVTSSVSQDKTHSVFPMSQYYLQNIEVPLTLKAGAVEKAAMSVTVTLLGIQTSDITIIGSDNAMFELADGYIIKDFNEANGRLEFEINGNISVSTISMSMQVSLGSTTKIDTKNFNLPIPGHMTVTVKSGSSITMAQDICLLPGSELRVENGATCIIAEGIRVIAYSWKDWTSQKGITDSNAQAYFTHLNKHYKNLWYSPSVTLVEGHINTQGLERNAQICIDGIVDASKGAVYTTINGADIYSNGTGKVVAKRGTENNTYQLFQTGSDSKTKDFVSIPIAPAKLKNANGTYVDTAVATSVETFEYINGVWSHVCEEEDIVTDAAKASTCTETGLTEGKHCTVCNTVLVAQEEIPAKGHTEETIPGKDATCTETGLTSGVKCVICGEIAVGLTEIPALGHEWVAADCETPKTCKTCGATEGDALGHDWVDADCETPKTCKTCGATEGDALGHDWADADCENPKTCKTCGETEGDALGHDWIDADCETPKTCKTCGKTEGDALGHDWVDAVVTAPTCTEDGYTTYTCSICGHIYIEEKVLATGHTEVTDEAVAPKCLATGLTAGKHCSVCGEVLVAQVEVPANGHNYQKVITEYSDIGISFITYTCTQCEDCYVLVIGDANHDGMIDTRDADAIRIYLEREDCIVFLLGDVNHDGKVNSRDAVDILRYLAGYEVKHFDKDIADFSRDGEVDSRDADAIIRYLAGYGL